MIVARRGLIWPILLVALGFVLLLANIGFIRFEARALLALWPLLLIIGGIELALSRRAPVTALALQLGAIALGIALVAMRPGASTLGFAIDIDHDDDGVAEATIARDGAQALDLRITGVAGRMRLSGGATALVEARSQRPDLDVRESRVRGDATVRIERDDGPFRRGVSDLAVQIADDVPLSLRMETGAGEFTLDLAAVRLRAATVKTGAATVMLSLPRSVAGDVPVRVESGASTIVIEVPDGIEARVTTRGGLITTTNDNPRMSARGVAAGAGSGVVETAGYSAARDRVSITVEAGATTVRVR